MSAVNQLKLQAGVSQFLSALHQIIEFYGDACEAFLNLHDKIVSSDDFHEQLERVAEIQIKNAEMSKSIAKSYAFFVHTVVQCHEAEKKNDGKD